jgi:chorismate synthase
MIENTDQRSKDYSEVAKAYRPGHADYAYDAKYGFRDYRGGGRSSARETAARVAAGGIARLVIPEVTITAHVVEIGGDLAQNFDAGEIANNPFFCADAAAAVRWEGLVDKARKAGSSLGAIVECVATGVPAGWGAPLYMKLDAQLAAACMSINAVKGVEIGDGFAAARLRGEKFRHITSRGNRASPAFREAPGASDSVSTTGAASPARRATARSLFSPFSSAGTGANGGNRVA